jgi:hypothetical protein
MSFLNLTTLQHHFLALQVVIVDANHLLGTGCLLFPLSSSPVDEDRCRVSLTDDWYNFEDHRRQ